MWITEGKNKEKIHSLNSEFAKDQERKGFLQVFQGGEQGQSLLLEMEQMVSLVQL